MDRQIIYPAQIPLDTDQLAQSRFTLHAMGELSRMIMDDETICGGLQVIPTVPASLAVQVLPGSILTNSVLDQNAYGTIAADTVTQTMKQGILAVTQNLTLTPPTTTGFAISYLIQAAFSELDDTPVLLPYYNSANPAVPYSGPNNSGVSQSTVRRGKCVVSAKPGIAATAGTQVPPAADAGYVPLAVVVVAQGATQITSAQITVPDVNGYNPVTLPNVPAGVQSGRWVYAIDTGAVNALVAKILPPVTSLVTGMEVRIRVANTNTGAATLNLNGIGASGIRRASGTSLQAGDLVAGQIAVLVWDGTFWQIENYQGISAGSTTINNYAVQIPYADDSGTANTMIGAFSPVVTTLAAGLIVEVKVEVTNTGATTLKCDALPARPVVRRDGTALQPGDLVAGQMALLAYDGTNFQVINLGGTTVTTGQTAIFDIPSTYNYNLRTDLLARGYDITKPITVIATLRSGSMLGGAPAFDTGIGYAAGTSLRLVIENGAHIIGYGGTGANGGAATDPSAGAGEDAMRVQVPLTVDNLGVIAGGGGGGGRSGGAQRNWLGSGGDGVPSGGGHGAGRVSNNPLLFKQPLQYGYSYAYWDQPGNYMNGGAPGGGWGQPGTASGGSGGGAAGRAVNGNSNITWQNTGSRFGALV